MVHGPRRGIPRSGKPYDAFPSGHAMHVGAVASAVSWCPARCRDHGHYRPPRSPWGRRWGRKSSRWRLSFSLTGLGSIHHAECGTRNGRQASLSEGRSWHGPYPNYDEAFGKARTTAKTGDRWWRLRAAIRLLGLSCKIQKFMPNLHSVARMTRTGTRAIVRMLWRKAQTQSWHRKRCLHVQALKSTAAFAIRNTRPDNGTGSGQEPPALLQYWCSVTLPGPDRPSSFLSCGLTHQRQFRFSAASLPQESSAQAQSGASRSRTPLPLPQRDLPG